MMLCEMSQYCISYSPVTQMSKNGQTIVNSFIPLSSFPGGLYCVSCCLLLQYLIQSYVRGGRRIVEDMCYEIRRAEACVD
jgi:hypothetical protein